MGWRGGGNCCVKQINCCDSQIRDWGVSGDPAVEPDVSSSKIKRGQHVRSRPLPCESWLFWPGFAQPALDLMNDRFPCDGRGLYGIDEL